MSDEGVCFRKLSLHRTVPLVPARSKVKGRGQAGLKPSPKPYQAMTARCDFIPGLDFFLSSFFIFILFGFGHKQEKLTSLQLKIP